MLVNAKLEKEYPWYVRLLFSMQKKKYGRVLEPTKLWALSPRVFLGLSHLYGALDRKSSPLSPELRSLITVKVSQINHCSFCVDINSALTLERGTSKEKLLALDKYAESALFSESEKTALKYAETITYTDRKVDSALASELSKNFSQNEILELSALIAFQNLSSKFNEALDIEPQGFCSIDGGTKE